MRFHFMNIFVSDLLTHGQCLGRPITISKITSCQSTMESNINPDSSLEIRCRYEKIDVDEEDNNADI